MINQILSQLSLVIFSIILMRIIEPSEFGLLAMVTVFSGFINIFIDFGRTDNSEKNITDIDISVAFITTVVIAFIMSISLYFLSRPISIFYDEARLVDITRIIAPIFLLSHLA